MSRLLPVILKVIVLQRRETHLIRTKAVDRPLSLLFMTFFTYFSEAGNATRIWIVFLGGLFLVGCTLVFTGGISEWPLQVGRCHSWKEWSTESSQGDKQEKQRKAPECKTITCCACWERGLCFRQIENLISAVMCINCEPWLSSILSEPPLPPPHTTSIHLIGFLRELIKTILAQCLEYIIKHSINISHFRMLFRMSGIPFLPFIILLLCTIPLSVRAPNLHLLPKAAPRKEWVSERFHDLSEFRTLVR